MRRQGEPSWKAARAAFTALSTSSLSPSATWQMTSPVDGLTVGNVFLLTALCHSLFMKILLQKTSGCWLGAGTAWVAAADKKRRPRRGPKRAAARNMAAG